MPNSRLLRLGAFLRPDTSRDLREQFYEVLCLVGVGLTLLVVIPVNALQNLPSIISIFAGILGLTFGGLYLAARRGHHHPGLFLAALITALNIAWFPNAGTHGSIPYYFFVPICYAVFFFDRAVRWTLCALINANVLVLMAIEWRYPDLLQPFHTEGDRFLDLASGLGVSFMACVLILWVVTSGYQRERERLKVTVAALTSSEERFAQLFMGNPDVAVVVDSLRRVLVDVNDAFTRATGWAREEAIGKSALDLGLWVNPADREHLFDEVARHGFVTGSIVEFRPRSGGTFWGSLSAKSTTHEGRELLLTTIRDVTSQVVAERAAAESRTLLSTLINSTDDLVWLVDPVHFTVTTFNAAFAAASRRHFGVEVYSGMPIDAFMMGPEAAVWRSLYARALAEDRFTIEYAVPGTEMIMLHSFSVVRHEGTPRGIAVFGKDITEMRRVEAKREQMELQLVEAQKMESLGSLAGGVAHDFNNMLGGIMGYSDMLLGEETDARRREYLEAILQAATRSAELTRKLLAFGRRGKNIVEAVDLNAVVTESVAMLRPSFRPDVRLDLHLDATWTVDGDPAQLSQLVVNLCINANEAMPSGGTLTICTRDGGQADGRDVERAAERVELCVSDTGTGMTEDVRARIFEPFFTTKLSGRAPGTGLGLSTVYGVVHLHHGTIDVRSAPAEGAAFTVTLPRGSLAVHSVPVAPERQQGRGLILIVEDEQVLRSFAAAALRKLGYTTLTAADGEEGVELFRDRHAELHGVLLDLKMPKKGGREAFLAFRELDPAVPVLICSGYGDNEEAQGLIPLGARGLLAKPYRISALADMLARLDAPRPA